MGKQLTIKDSVTDKTYTLEYNRRSIQALEAKGLIITDIEEKPATMLPLLIEGAFYMHHRGLQPNKIDAIYDNIPDKEGFIEALAEMYAEPLEALLDNPTGPKSKNATWTKSW
jgi:hypothetical protein